MYLFRNLGSSSTSSVALLQGCVTLLTAMIFPLLPGSLALKTSRQPPLPMSLREANDSSFSKKAKSSALLIKRLNIVGLNGFSGPLLALRINLKITPEMIPPMPTTTNPKIQATTIFLLFFFFFFFFFLSFGGDTVAFVVVVVLLGFFVEFVDGVSARMCLVWYGDILILLITGTGPSNNRFSEKSKNRRLLYDTTGSGILPEKRLFATERLSRLGRFFKKFKFPENLFEERFIIRRLTRREKFAGV